METRQTETGAHVVSVNDSRVCKEDDGINMRNNIIIWIIKKKREAFNEAVQLTSERNIVRLAYVLWRKPALKKRDK